MGMKTYNERKHKGLCPRCGKVKAKQHKTCSACRKKIREYQYNRIMAMSEELYAEHKEGIAYSTLKRKHYIKDNNLCVTCGKAKDTNGVRCESCRIKHNNKNRLAWRNRND